MGKSSKAMTAKKGKRAKKSISQGVVHVHASYNNTIICITDRQGNTLAWDTAGKHFKGSRKSTPFSAQVASKHAAEKAKMFGLESVDVYIKGPGPGREAAIRPLEEFFSVLCIKDVTGIPHNGCRAEKERRV